MNDNSGSDPMKALWQSQPIEPPQIRREDLRRAMDKFERKVFWRNLREYAAGALVIAIFGYYGVQMDGVLLRVGAGLVIAGALVLMLELHRRGSVQTAPADLGLSTCIEYHRKSLERQRDALRAVWTWYLLPFVPGLAVFEVGIVVAQWKAHPYGLKYFILASLLSPAFVAAVFFGIWRLNRWAAGKLQKRIDELRALGDAPNE